MNTVVTKRKFNVPVNTLYTAWVNPEHLQNWWGPNGFTNTFHEFDLCEGGLWRFTMHGPNGKNYQNESVFEKIILNECIVFEHISEPRFKTECLFMALDEEGSAIEWKMTFVDTEIYQLLKDYIAEKNEENLNRLETELIKMKGYAQ